MSLSDLGSLQDYVLNGDNYEKVNPDGSTLVIPTNHQGTIVVPLALCGNDQACVPDSPLNTWNVLDPSCAFDDTLYCIGHDRTTDFYFFGYNCSPPFLEGDCEQACAGYMASVDGGPLGAVFPFWLIQALGFPDSATISVDYYFTSCPGVTIVIPNFPNPKTSICPPPGRIQLQNGVPICFFDPPIPSNLPRHQAAKFGAPSRPRASGGQISKLSKIQRLINPTLNGGRPVMVDCGCGPNAVKPFEEELL